MKKLIIIFLLSCSCIAQAQIKKPYFNTFDVRSGLPEAYIAATLEDNNGYLWMGTQNGLVRYDGYQFKAYPMRNSKGNIISPNSVRNLLEDDKGKIWAYIRDEGIHYYDTQTDKFVLAPFDQKTMSTISNEFPFGWIDDVDNHSQWLTTGNYITREFSIYKFNTKDNTLIKYASAGEGKQQLPTKTPPEIIKDAYGKIWLASGNVLSYFDVKNQQFTPYFTLPQSLKDYNLFGLISEPTDNDIVWMNTINGQDVFNAQTSQFGKTVLRFNIKTKVYQLFSPDDKNATALPANCRTILTDSLKRLWLATDKGMSLYNADQNNFTNYTIDFNQENGSARVICSDGKDNLWIGGNFNNLYVLNTKTGINQKIESGTYKGSLPDFKREINNIFYDRSGTLWVSMPWWGIAHYDKQKTLFAPTPLNLDGLLEADKINRSQIEIRGSQGDSICFVANTASLYAWHTRSNQYSNIDLKNKEAYENIRAVVADKDGNVWIASIGIGLFNYNPKTKAVQKWEHNAVDSLSLISNSITNLAVDKQGIVWIGTNDQGLCSYSPVTNRFTNYPYILNDEKTIPENALDDIRVISLMIDSEGIIWIGTNNGALNSYHPKTNQFKSYLNPDQSFVCVPSIMEDSQKRIWAGTYQSGLYLIDKQKGIVKRYNEAVGLLHNQIVSITEDASGKIWSGTLRGYSKVNPATNEIDNYPIAFENNNRTLEFLHKDASGTIYNNYNEGLVRFNPAEIQPNPIAPSVVIESIKYQSAKTAKDTTQYAQANQNFTQSYNENKIEFQFVALHYADASENEYAYQLIGYDKDWVQAGTNRSTTYTNLSPGDYTFKVKAANSDGVWNETGSSISLKILPPWWQTWWAYTIYALLFLAALRAFSMYREKRLRDEKKILEEKVSARTTDLKQSLESLKATQAQLVQSEKMASLGELTAGIAHEIQNPLNFVNNFSEVSVEMMQEVREEIATVKAYRDKPIPDGALDEISTILDDIESNLGKINHHGKRADSIVKGMLQHSRSNSGTKEPTDINALCDEYLRLSYHGLRAKDKDFNATLITNFEEGLDKVNVIPQDLGRVVLNLLTNAFYAVNEKSSLAKASEDKNYEPTVSIITKTVGKHLEISIKDNGNGMPQEVVDKIFQPFFTTKPTGKGTGLGLSMSYDIVTKGHAGELKVETEQNEGTEFIIRLPITD